MSTPPETDGKTKNEHFREMLIRAKSDKRLKASTVLFDSWYASVENLKMIHRLGMVFISTLKSNRSNRLVSTSKEQHQASKEQHQASKEQHQASKEQNRGKSGKGKANGYVHLDTLGWSQDSLRHGACLPAVRAVETAGATHGGFPIRGHPQPQHVPRQRDRHVRGADHPPL